MADRGPGLRFPPPLIPLAVVAGAIAADYFLGVPRLPPQVRLLGLPWILAGGALIAWALAHLRRAKTSPYPWQPTTALVETGPYAQSRNPIYLAFVVLQLGLGLLFGSWSILVGLTPTVLLLQVLVVGPEEKYLARQFPLVYEDYRGRVRRWL